MADGKISTEFPNWLTESDVVELSEFTSSREQLYRNCTYFYLGHTCYLYTWQEVSEASLTLQPIREECRHGGSIDSASQQFTRNIESAMDVPYLVPLSPTVTIGFIPIPESGSEESGYLGI